ncbi:hypothetical protein GR7B_00058 [Vibrio phage vB_VcorM_GR7B]|nr:hypothetical protein GR7B_00058 [Vibrio phage vB_VcorM_GR7B]
MRILSILSLLIAATITIPAANAADQFVTQKEFKESQGEQDFRVYRNSKNIRSATVIANNNMNNIKEHNKALAKLGSDLTAEEKARAKGDADTLTQAKAYSDAGDANVLNAAISTAKQQDANNLAEAKAHAESGDFATLEKSKTYADNIVIEEINNQFKNFPSSAGVTKGDAIQKAIDEGDAATLDSSKTYTDQEVSKGNTTTLKSSKQYSDEVVSAYKAEQAKVDANQYTSIEELYAMGNSQSATLQKHGSRLSSLEGRMGKVENDIVGLKEDINRLDGMQAANAAANSIVMPSNYDGTLSFGVGVGHYRDHNGLALGAVHDGGNYAVKLTVAGTDADDWRDLQYGASISFVPSF